MDTDAHLKTLAGISLALSSAEELLDDGANTSAREPLDRAADGLAALRAQWPQLSVGERALIGRTAAPLRDRLDAARARLPRMSTLTQVAPEPGDEDEDGPDDATPRAPAPPPA